MPKTKKDTLVFLDAGTVDYGDLSLDPFRKLGWLIAHHHTRPSDIVRRAARADILLVNKCPLDEKKLGALKRVRLICLAATGTNNIDLNAARRLEIAVANVAGYSTEVMAQGAWALLLAAAGNLIPFDRAVRQGLWSRSPFFTLRSFKVTEVREKVLGIIGYGKIGRRVAQIAKVFGMKVLIARMPGKNYPAKATGRRVSITRLLASSDFVSLHAPLTPETAKLINASRLRQMKKSAILVNTARGGLIDEIALGKALHSRQIAGAALDVLTQEPPPRNHPLFKAPNLILMPHASWTSVETRRNLVEEMAKNILAFRAGRRRNRVA